MGMSHDLSVAIERRFDILRIGTAILGSRLKYETAVENVQIEI